MKTLVEKNKGSDQREKQRILNELILPLPQAAYTCDQPIYMLEKSLNDYKKDWGLNLNPDFQRGHVWTMNQRIAFVEGVLRGTVDRSLMLIQFNAPHWITDNHKGDLPNEIQIVDGLQRLNTIRGFLDHQFPVFGLYVDEFKGTSFDINLTRYALRFAIHNFQSKKDLLNYYLSINSGGTVHSEEELDRVRLMTRGLNEDQKATKSIGNQLAKICEVPLQVMTDVTPVEANLDTARSKESAPSIQNGVG